MNGSTKGRKTIGWLLAGLLLALALAGCGVSDEVVGSASSAVEPATVRLEPTAELEAEVEAAAEADTDGDSEAEADDEHDDDSDHSDDAEPAEAVGTDPVLVANAMYLDSYTLVDEAFGTMVTVTVEGATRTIESNTLPNHETGEFPNSGNPNEISEQDRTWTLTTEPEYIGTPQTVRETGVALNGVKFEPGTAESVTCESGENYRIEGLQQLVDLGMDFNNAHVQPTGEYHYHGVSELLVDAFDNDADLVLVGFAADGHAMYYSKSNAYPASYSLSDATRTGNDCAYRGQTSEIADTAPDGTYVSDWIYVEGQGALDECNGTFIDGQYSYLVTDEYPYISRCLMGEVEGDAGGPGGQAPGAQQGQAPGGQEGQAPGGQAGQAPGGPPDLTDAAAALGVTAEELQNALGGPPPDVAAAAESLGLSTDELLAVLTEYGVAPPA